MKDCPMAKVNPIQGKKVTPNNVEVVSKVKNRFYALRSKGDQECSSYDPFRYVSL